MVQRRSVTVTTFPSSKKEKFIAVAPDAFEAYVREPAQHNMANTRVRELVAAFFAVPVSSVIISTGHRARKKRVVVTISP